MTGVTSKCLMLTTFLCIVVSFTVKAQPISHYLFPKVDERVELLGIVYRLAKPAEFSRDINTNYSKAISNHFDQYASHPLIKHLIFISDSLSKKDVELGYWKLLALAVHLSHPPSLEPLVPINSFSSDVWDNRELFEAKTIKLLQAFYQDAKCETFFKSQAAYYQSVNRWYEINGKKIDKKWFDHFFGLQPSENYYPIIGIAVGNGEYLRVNGHNNHRSTYTVFGCHGFDSNGLPTNFSEPIFSWLLIHEYVHAFTNQLIDDHIHRLQPSAETLISDPEVFALMKDTFYGNWKFLLYESFVRGCHIKYWMDHEIDNSLATAEISRQEKAGFLWINGFVGKLKEYEKNRKNYKDLNAFMPELINYFDQVAKELKN